MKFWMMGSSTVVSGAPETSPLSIEKNRVPKGGSIGRAGGLHTT